MVKVQKILILLLRLIFSRKNDALLVCSGGALYLVISRGF
jgi:hypothetical protein